MSAIEVVALVAAAVDAIAKLIASGISHDAALERIRSIAPDAAESRAAVDAIASGS